MATYTPNINLYMPDPTDDFGEFRKKHNDNMVKIDNAVGGGGGSGGHTIVNPSGTDMPAEGKLQFTGGVTVTDDSVNGKTVVDISGGGGNVYGAFIDTNRVITSGTYSSSNPLVYTATEDCFADIAFLSADGDKNVYAWIDGVQVDRLFNNAGIVVSNEIYPLRKGQTLRVETSRVDPDSAYTIYGTTQGTNGIFTPIIYSDTERVVGVWRDNKPLYQRTFVLPTPIDVSYSSWTSMGVSVADGERVIRCEGVDNTDGLFNPLMAWFNNGVIECQTPRNNSNSWQIKYLSVWYTKTTDVAGSGNWNTDGVPTVHYSTSEQVIGTWLGKPLYQRTWDFISTNIINANTWTNLFSNDIDIDKITMNETLDDEGRSNKVAYCGVRNGYVAVYSTYTTNIQTITLRYTKSTD